MVIPLLIPNPPGHLTSCAHRHNSEWLIKTQGDDTVARISVTGRLSVSLGGNGVLQLAINGIMHRSLRDMIDLDTEVNGNFRYAGEFGKGGSNAEITAPVKLTRTVKVLSR